MSRGKGAGARWQEMTHPVNSKGPREDKGRQGPPGWQETTPLGGKGLSHRQRQVGKGGNLEVIFSSHALLSIRSALQIRSIHQAPRP